MTELEKAVEALKMCVPQGKYEEALKKVEKHHGGANVPKRKRETTEVITRLLLDMGMTQNIKGFRFSVTAIELILADPKMLDGITKWLYPEVAKIHSSLPTRVERAIRHGIEMAFERGDPEVHYACFRNSISGAKGKPTVSEFLARMADVARMELDD